jgi:hypothetical protein
MSLVKRELMEKRGNTLITATQTIASLRILNDGKDFRSLLFLTDVPAVVAKLADKTDETQKTYYGRVLAALRVMGERRYSRSIRAYTELFEGKKTTLEKLKKEGTKTAKEKENWMSWPKVLEMHEAMSLIVKGLMETMKERDLTESEYRTVMAHLAMSLYVLMPPRRTTDYLKMWVCEERLLNNKERNYYIRKEGKMYFNNYKTAKTYGQQVVDVPERLRDIIDAAMKCTETWRRSRGRARTMPMFCDYEGIHKPAPHTMTLLLNHAFGGKRIASTQLRRIYVSHLYGEEILKMSTEAAAMAHDIGTHLRYYRTDSKKVADLSSSDDSDSDDDRIKHL